MRRHRTDDMRLVADMRGSRIGGKPVGLCGRPGGDVFLHESVQRSGAVIRDHAEPRPANRQSSFFSAFNLGGAGDKQLAIVAAALAARRRIVLGPEGNVSLSTSTKPLSGERPGATVAMRSFTANSQALL